MTPKEIRELNHLRKIKKVLGLSKERKKRYRLLKRKFRSELSKKEQRLEKMRRSLTKVSAKMGLADPAPRVNKAPPPRDIDMGLPIKDEVAVHLAERKAHIERVRKSAESFGPNLVHLYNDKGVDFVKKKANGTIVPVTWPKQATHKLIPTMEAEKTPATVNLIVDRENQTNTIGKVVSVGYTGRVHAVCMVPMKKPEPKPVKDFHLARPLSRWSKRWPPYKTEWEIRKKRIALCEYARLTGVYRAMRAKIEASGHVQCNAMLKAFINASRALRAAQAKDPKMKAFWKKRKKQMAELKKKEAETQMPPPPVPPKPKGFLDHLDDETKKVMQTELTTLLRRNQLG